MSAILSAPAPAKTSRTALPVIDCDIHNAPVSLDALAAHLPARWQRHVQQFGLRSFSGATYPRLHPNAARTDAWPDDGPPGSSLALMQEQLLDAWAIEIGILNPLFGVGAQTNLALSAALATAINRWQTAEWLDPEPRLRASIVVPVEDGEATAAEIRRAARDPRFVQILLVARTHEPLGRRKYWPMFQAAVEHDLPIGIHFGGNSGWPITGAGWPSFYMEDHVGMPQSFQPQIASLVFEGVFERFPGLKVVLIEGGFAWIPPLMWRLDRAWALLRDEVPHVTRPPSELLREHIWITTQPIEEPPVPAYFTQMLAQFAMDDRFLFATDYPHWDFDAPDQALPNTLTHEQRAAFLAGNARAFYRL